MTNALDAIAARVSSGCWSGKAPHLSLADARLQAQRANASRPREAAPVTAYECTQCGFWHIGRKSFRGSTSPDEKLRAIQAAEEIMKKIASGRFRVPEELRREARRALRHYPTRIDTERWLMKHDEAVGCPTPRRVISEG